MTNSINTPKNDVLVETSCDLPIHSPETSTNLSIHKFALPSIAITSLLSACGGKGIAIPSEFNDPALILQPDDDIDAARFLQQASFSSQLDEIAQVHEIGYDAWITQQAEMDINANAFEDSTDDSRFVYSSASELWYIWSDMITAENTLRLRMTYALSQIIVVSSDNSGVNLWPGKAMAHYWDILKRHALGNYRELLEEITLSIPMGFYLSMKGNQKADEAGRRPDENYAREIMELFSIGLMELNMDGTPVLDELGNPIPTYDQETIFNLARVFTGWDLDHTKEWLENINLPMTHYPERHSPEEKVFLGTTIPENTSGPESLQIALDTIFEHPNVAPFISKQLIQRFVTSNPSPDYIRRVAETFENNGNNERGDLQSVIRAILLDDEARSKPDPNSISNGKVREPVLMQIQWLKFTDAISPHTGTFQSQDAGIEQRPCRAPSVFNFYRPDYATTQLAQNSQEQLNKTLYSPELQLFNESTIAQHANTFEEATTKGMRNITGLEGSDAFPTYQSLVELADNIDALINYADLVFCAGSLSSTTKSDLVELLSLNQHEGADVRLRRSQLLTLALKLHADYMVMK